VPGAQDYPRLVKEVLDTSLRVQSGDKVWIQGWDHSLDLAKAFASECSVRACPCFLTVRYQDVWLRSIIEGPLKQIESISSQERAALEETDFYIITMGPRSPIPWGSIPQEKRKQVSLWLDTRYDKSSYARSWARVAKTNEVKMLAIEATLATPERAKAQGLDYREWRKVMFQGCMADNKAIAIRAKKLARFISGKGNVSVASPSGTRLNFDLARRSVDISDGISTGEMAEKGRIVFLPAGAIEVSVDEESAEGKIVYDAPARVGSEKLENLIVDVKGGRIVRFNATRGREAFEQYLLDGGKDAERLAFFGFGLNPNLKHGFTQDDKVLGGLTLGFGSNKSMGGKNSASDQWWASITRSTVKVEGSTLVEDGKLLI
jgi:leucyl aminopeptidase (aminopeptidase T)